MRTAFLGGGDDYSETASTTVSGSDGIGIALAFNTGSRAIDRTQLNGTLTATLTTTSGYSDTKTMTVTDGKGSTTFNAVPIGDTATITATFTDTDGTVWQGSGSSVVAATGTRITVELSIAGTYSLPASLEISANAASIATNTDRVTFSITNMSNAPSVGVTYKWYQSATTDGSESWTEISGATGTSVTRSGTDFGGMPPEPTAGIPVTKTAKVKAEATYIRNGESAGTSVSGKSSGIPMTTGPVIPDFAITVTLNDFTQESDIYLIPTTELDSGNFVFTPVPSPSLPGATFPTDTVFKWSTEEGILLGTTRISTTPGSEKFSTTPSALGVSATELQNSPDGLFVSVICEPSSASASNGTTANVMELEFTVKQPKCAKPTITIAPSTGSTARAVSGGEGEYEVVDSSSFDFKVTSPETGVTYTWYQGSTTNPDIGAFTSQARTPYKTDTTTLPAELSYICVASKTGYASAVSDAETLELVLKEVITEEVITATIGTTEYTSKREFLTALKNATGNVTVTVADLKGDLGYSSNEGTLGYAVRNSTATSINLDMSGSTDLTTIGFNSFYRCNKLASIIIPEGVTSIEMFALSECSSLTSVSLPSTLRELGDCVFKESGLTRLSIPNGVTTIPLQLCYKCPLTSISIPTSVTTIQMQAFLNTNLSTVENAVLTGWKVYDSGSEGELGEFIEDKNFGSYSDFASYLKGDGCYKALSRE